MFRGCTLTLPVKSIQKGNYDSRAKKPFGNITRHRVPRFVQKM